MFGLSAEYSNIDGGHVSVFFISNINTYNTSKLCTVYKNTALDTPPPLAVAAFYQLNIYR